MGAKYTLDHTNRLFILDQVAPDGNGFVRIDFQVDLYSDWKEDALSGTFNTGVDAPFRTTGGDTLGGGKIIAPYFFFINGWKIRPYEADHTLVVSGSAYTDPDTNEFVVPTVGAYSVNVIVERAVDAVGVDAVNVGSINDSTIAAEKLAAGAELVVPGTVVAGDLSTTRISCDITELTNNHFNKRVVIFRTGALAYQQAKITGYEGWGGSYSVLVVETMTDTPQIGDTFLVV